MIDNTYLDAHNLRYLQFKGARMGGDIKDFGKLPPMAVGRADLDRPVIGLKTRKLHMLI